MVFPPVHQIGGQRGQIHGTATGVCNRRWRRFLQNSVCSHWALSSGIAQALQEELPLASKCVLAYSRKGAGSVRPGSLTGGLPDVIAQLVDEFGQRRC